MESSLRNGFDYCKRHLTWIVKISTFLTVAVLIVIGGTLASSKKHPLLATYAVILGLLIFGLEVIVPLLARMEVGTNQDSSTAWLKEKSGVVYRTITPLKKCVLYGVASLPLFIHMTIAVLGAILLLITTVFIAGQYDDSDTQSNSDYAALRAEDDGTLSGISSGDIVAVGREPAILPETGSKSMGGADAKHDAGWDMMSDNNDDNLLLG